MNRANELELENAELQRLLTQAVFRSKSLEVHFLFSLSMFCVTHLFFICMNMQSQLQAIPQDMHVANAEKRVLESRLAQATHEVDQMRKVCLRRHPNTNPFLIY